jgi:hypothetical protein
MSTAKKHVPAPLFFLVVRIPAWTIEQAERLEKEVRDKFTAHDVTREENTAPAPEKPATPGAETAPGSQANVTELPASLTAKIVPKKHVESFLAQLLQDGVPESKLVHALGVFVETKKPKPAAAPVEAKPDEPPPVFGPFGEGDTLADKYVDGRIVIVAGIDEHGWTWTDKDGNTGANAWADAEHYAKVSAKKAEKIAKESLSTSTPAATTTEAGSPSAGDDAAASAGAKTINFSPTFSDSSPRTPAAARSRPAKLPIG